MRETTEKYIPVNPARPARMPNVRDCQGFVLFNFIQFWEVSRLAVYSCEVRVLGDVK
jgi:hypothetical protein